MRSLIAIALCLLCAGPAAAGTFQTYEKPHRTIHASTTAAGPPVRVYGLDHRVTGSGGHFVVVDWSVNVSAPGRSSCEVEFWFLDEAGNPIHQDTQSTHLDSQGFVAAHGKVAITPANASAVHELSAKASCI